MDNYKIGYCIKCNAQCAITDRKNRIMSWLKGSKTVFLLLKDIDDTIRTRVGPVPVCSSCKFENLDPEQIKLALINSKFSGVSENEPEFKRHPNLGVELYKTYGEN